ncbi:thioredoxin family protein [Clostridium sp. C105KSO13]|uniref:thioredoxin family protein n=1 Tax=Clostridium sp. C105KSO13 TaxID=1776045 RepID=UPI0007406B20|nr:thioredoxin domain-containing protein [Clostridium sp. C105KSO13]CUX30311.1 Thioredoxin-1 [Clostridium sp. C105KSO13]
MKISVTAKNYPQEVLHSEISVLVEFFAAWCAKCAMMESVVDELSEGYDGKVKICQIDIDKNKALAAEFGVGIVPTFVLFKKGKPVSAAGGILSRKVLEDMIKE